MSDGRAAQLSANIRGRNDELWTALTFVLGISFRLLAIRYKWEMPKFVFGADKKN